MHLMDASTTSELRTPRAPIDGSALTTTPAAGAKSASSASSALQ
jgi:hypothetical protein